MLLALLAAQRLTSSSFSAPRKQPKHGPQRARPQARNGTAEAEHQARRINRRFVSRQYTRRAPSQSNANGHLKATLLLQGTAAVQPRGKANPQALTLITCRTQARGQAGLKPNALSSPEANGWLTADAGTTTSHAPTRLEKPSHPSAVWVRAQRPGVLVASSSVPLVPVQGPCRGPFRAVRSPALRCAQAL